MLFRYTNLNFLKFINHYDLINKYSYKNFYLIPYYTKLSFKIFLKGLFNLKTFKKYLINFLLLYFCCFNFPQTSLKLFKLKNRKQRIYKVKLFLNYYVMKKKILLTIYNLFFLFNKFIRPFFFSIQKNNFSIFGGKLFFCNIKIIVFLPQTLLVDSNEQKFLKFLKKSKIFLTISLKNIVQKKYCNFFFDNLIINKKFLKNFLLIWYLI